MATSMPMLSNMMKPPTAQGGILAPLASTISHIGNAGSGIVPQAQPAPIATAPLAPTSGVSPLGGTAPGVHQVANAPIPMGVNSDGQMPVIGPASTGSSMVAEDNNSLYGVDTGTTLTNLYNSENPTNGQGLAQQVIQANLPNVARGQDNLNTRLAASGIGPSSSVSAIENANYIAGVENQNLSWLSDFSLEEQKMQQDLLKSILPGEQQRQTDSSGWSIFNDVMTGIGDIVSTIPTGGVA